MAKQVKGEIVEVGGGTRLDGFDYSRLETSLAESVQRSAERIRGKLKRSIEDIVEVGNDLIAVKEQLLHGQFTGWLRAEFGWADRMARTFMSVAEQFGPKVEKISNLPIVPSAAYILAAPSVPEEARKKAIEKAKEGKTISVIVAKTIIAETRSELREEKGGQARKKRSASVLGPKLLSTLEKYLKGWASNDLPDLAQQLRQFADKVEKQHQQREAKKAKKE